MNGDAPAGRRAPGVGAPLVVMLSSAHPPTDVRIVEKEGAALAAAGWDVVHLCPAPTNRAAQVPVTHAGVAIRTYPRVNGLLARWRGRKRLARRAQELLPDVVHAHEPDSWLAAIRVAKRTGAFAVLDVHEHYPSRLDSRVPRGLRWLARLVLRRICAWSGRRADAVIVAKDGLADAFPGAPEIIPVRNYAAAAPVTPREHGPGPLTLLHLGALTRERGAFEMLRALKLCPPGTRLALIGRFTDGSEPAFKAEARGLGLTDRVDQYGWMPHTEALAGASRADVGLVLFQPGVENHRLALPHKLFDCMLAGLPVIVPAFAEEVAAVVREAACGVLVDTTDPQAIAAAVSALADPAIRAELGANGRAAALGRFGWAGEAERLTRLYRDLAPLPGTAAAPASDYLRPRVGIPEPAEPSPTPAPDVAPRSWAAPPPDATRSVPAVEPAPVEAPPPAETPKTAPTPEPATDTVVSPVVFPWEPTGAVAARPPPAAPATAAPPDRQAVAPASAPEPIAAAPAFPLLDLGTPPPADAAVMPSPGTRAAPPPLLAPVAEPRESPATVLIASPPAALGVEPAPETPARPQDATVTAPPLVPSLAPAAPAEVQDTPAPGPVTVQPVARMIPAPADGTSRAIRDAPTSFPLLAAAPAPAQASGTRESAPPGPAADAPTAPTAPVTTGEAPLPRPGLQRAPAAPPAPAVPPAQPREQVLAPVSAAALPAAPPQPAEPPPTPVAPATLAGPPRQPSPAPEPFVPPRLLQEAPLVGSAEMPAHLAAFFARDPLPEQPDDPDRKVPLKLLQAAARHVNHAPVAPASSSVDWPLLHAAEAPRPGDRP